MRMSRGFVVMMLAVPSLVLLTGAQEPARKGAPGFKSDVMPLFRKHCLPCHAEESFNPSALSLDDHARLMKGGEHGAAVVPGKPDESLLVQKVLDDPPFGDRMPLQSRRRKKVDRPVKLTAEEVAVLREWVAAGAKND